jgi:putative CocE/NonD family hydrolase
MAIITTTQPSWKRKCSGAWHNIDLLYLQEVNREIPFNFSLLFLLFSVHTLQAQEISFPHDSLRDSTAMAHAMPALAKQVMAIYVTRPRTNPIIYYNTLARYQIITGQYEAALAAADSAKALYRPADSALAQSNIFPFCAYAATRLVMSKLADDDFPRSFGPIFTALYEPMSAKAAKGAENYYRADLATRRQNYYILTSRLKAAAKDSISFAEAGSLCFNWMNYVVYGAELPLAGGLIKSIAKEHYIIEDSVLIPTRDGAQIAATIVRSRSLSGPQPVVLRFGIYASPTEVPETKYIAGHGYVGVIADTRGKRLSPQPIEPFIHDANDAYDIIDWISHQPWCNGKIGMYGGSYVGFATWAALKHPHPALKTIVPIAAVGQGVDWPNLNGVKESGLETLHWLRLVMDNKFSDGVDRGPESRWDSLAKLAYTSGIADRALDSLEGHPNAVYQEILRHPTFDSFWKNMGPTGSEFARINIPILTITGYYDDDQRGALYYFNQHHQYAANSQHYLLIGPYDHGGVQEDDPPANVWGYSVDSAARLSLGDVMFGWFDHVLKGAPLPDLLKDRINVEVMGENRWRHVASLRQLNNDTLTFYLSGARDSSNPPDSSNRYRLAPAPDIHSDEEEADQYADFSDRNDFKDHDKYYINGDGPVLSKALDLPQVFLTFASDPTSRDFELNGSFIADLEATVNKRDADLVVDLYQQTPDGKYFQLSNNSFRCSHLKDISRRELLTPGRPAHLYFDNSFFTSRHIEKGSRLILAVGIAKSSDLQINYGTGKDVSVETIHDAAEPMHIQWQLAHCRIRLPVWWE